MKAASRSRAGFTLFEVLGVVFITALVLGFATDYFIDLSRASQRASDTTRDVRHAAAILDRIARDFEGTLLVVKPEEVDPLSHPWLFVAEARGGGSGADHIKFIARNFQPRRSEAHESDLNVIAYVTAPGEDPGRLDLYRWTSPRLPEELDRTFPSPDAEASVLLAEGLTDFGVRFYDESGEETDSWDSTTAARSSTLPSSVLITVGVSEAPEAEIDPDAPALFSRRVVLPLRPLDMVALLDPQRGLAGGTADETDANGDGIPDSEQEPGDFSGLRVSDCVDLQGWVERYDRDQTTPIFMEQVLQKASLPWVEVRDSLPPELRTRFLIRRPGCI